MKKITCVVDNTVMSGSELWGTHGISWLIESDRGRVLFDTGNNEAVLRHNLARLGECLCNVDALALSHAHWDHTGGLDAVRWQRPGLPLYANSDLFRPRFARRDGRYEPIGMRHSADDLTRAFDLRLNNAPTEIIPGLWTTGEIQVRTERAGGSSRHLIRQGEGWIQDPYRDDMSLVLETETGLVLICGCCHAGLLNTLAHVEQHFGQPVTTILGGTHLVTAKVADLAHIIALLRDDYGVPQLYLSHCTGTQALFALTTAFGEKVAPCPAGTVLEFET